MTSELFVDAPDQLRSEILRICIRLLESPDLTIEDDFFDKGGDSLLATELMLELRQLTGKALPDSLLFESSTVRALAERLGEKEAPRPKPVVRVGAASDGATPLLFFHGDWTRGGFLRRASRSKAGTASFAHRGCASWPRRRADSSVDRRDGGRSIARDFSGPADRPLPTGRALRRRNRGASRRRGCLMKLNHRVEVAMIDSPRVVGGQVLRTQGADGRGNAGADDDPAAAPDDIPVRPAMPEFDWGFEAYESRLAAYSPTPLPVRLLVLASEYDGRDWVRLSGDADLVELPGRHFDLVTTRINDLARELNSWLFSGDEPVGLRERNPPSFQTDKTSS